MYQAPDGSQWDHAVDLPVTGSNIDKLIQFCNRYVANAYTWQNIHGTTYRFFFRMKHHADAFKESFSLDNPVVPPAPQVAPTQLGKPTKGPKTTGSTPLRDALGRFVTRGAAAQAKGIAPNPTTGQGDARGTGPTLYPRAGRRQPSPLTTPTTQITATNGADLARQLKKPEPPQAIGITINGRRTSITFQHLAPEDVEKLGLRLIDECYAAERDAAPKIPNWSYQEFRSTVMRQFEIFDANNYAPFPADVENLEALKRFVAAADDASRGTLVNQVIADVFLKRTFFLSKRFGPRDIAAFSDWFEATFNVVL